MRIFKKFAVVILLLLVCIASSAKAQPLNIKNDIFWNTINGNPINSQGGGIFRFTDPITGIEK
ncbi:MAG: hypothetical protein RIR31_1474, partial [Bacteroidota bacterium]